MHFLIGVKAMPLSPASDPGGVCIVDSSGQD
jgi:hypothetical protein